MKSADLEVYICILFKFGTIYYYFLVDCNILDINQWRTIFL